MQLMTSGNKDDISLPTVSAAITCMKHIGIFTIPREHVAQRGRNCLKGAKTVTLADLFDGVLHDGVFRRVQLGLELRHLA